MSELLEWEAEEKARINRMMTRYKHETSCVDKNCFSTGFHLLGLTKKDRSLLFSEDKPHVQMALDEFLVEIPVIIDNSVVIYFCQEQKPFHCVYIDSVEPFHAVHREGNNGVLFETGYDLKDLVTPYFESLRGKNLLYEAQRTLTPRVFRMIRGDELECEIDEFIQKLKKWNEIAIDEPNLS